MNLEEKIISEITGEFTIEAYQRGYRWGKDEVEHLLEDINEIPDGQKLCLQPVVVKNVNGIYELIERCPGVEKLDVVTSHRRSSNMAKKYSDNPKLAELVAELKELGE